MKPSSVAGIIVILFLAGCSIEVKMNEKSETDMGSHHVIVKPHSTLTSSSLSGGDIKTYRYRCGDVIVEIKNEQLIVNNVQYGELSPGVDILIDHGTVHVDGEIREGVTMTPQEKHGPVR